MDDKPREAPEALPEALPEGRQMGEPCRAPVWAASSRERGPLCIDLAESSDDEAPLIALAPRPLAKRARTACSAPAGTGCGARLCGPGARARPGESDADFARRLQDEEEKQPARDAELARRLQQEEQRAAAGRELQRRLPDPQPPPEEPPPAASAASPAVPGLGPLELQRVARLPEDLIARAPPRFEVCGTGSEPVIYAKDVDGARGRLLGGRVLDELLRGGRAPLAPAPGQRDGVVVEWHRRRRAPDPWRTGVRVLDDVAEQLLAHLRRDEALLERVPALRCDGRPWNDAEVLVTTPGCFLGRHSDAQPAGSLLVIFCVGLACRSQAWPGGRLTERTLESGDVMIFDGRRTKHAVPQVLGGTSPMPRCGWLGQRRLAVLVRQAPPGVRLSWPGGAAPPR